MVTRPRYFRAHKGISDVGELTLQQCLTTVLHISETGCSDPRGREGAPVAICRKRSAKSSCVNCGRPFIDWMLTALRSQGIRRAVLCTGHLAAMLRDYVSDGQRWGVQVIHSSEDQPLGTGGALRNALPVIDSDPVLVLNGDSLCQFDLDRFACLASTARLASFDSPGPC